MSDLKLKTLLLNISKEGFIFIFYGQNYILRAINNTFYQELKNFNFNPPYKKLSFPVY